MDYLDEMRKYVRTEKQKAFEIDFLKGAENYETWDEVEMGKHYVAENTFEVKAEDMKFYAEAVLDNNPLFHDEEYAKKSPWGGLVPHPLFITEIAFWCGGTGTGSWARTPGARNPGQVIEFYEPFRVGDVITVKQYSYDKWIKRGKYYLTYQNDYIDQNGTLKARWWGTLILPRTREDIVKFTRGERGLEV